MLMFRGILGGLGQVVIFGALLLIPAGTWQWPRAIQFLVAYALVVTASTVWLAVSAPESLEARLQPAVDKTQPTSDKVATLVLTIAMLGWFVFVPIDVFRLGLLPPPSLASSVLGAIVGLAGFGIMMATLLQNAYAAPIVKDQTDRGQVLIDTGLYARIRHPFYLGLLLFFAGTGWWLESYASVIAVLVVWASLIPRITTEERTLRETLEGYEDYLRRVPHRLIPRIW